MVFVVTAKRSDVSCFAFPTQFLAQCMVIIVSSGVDKAQVLGHGLNMYSAIQRCGDAVGAITADRRGMLVAG